MVRKACLWVTGWSATPAVWREIQQHLPGIRHVNVPVHRCSHPEQIVDTILEAGESVRECRRVAAVGWSMGAMAALEACLQAPELFQRLVLIGAVGRFTNNRINPRGWDRSVLEQMKEQMSHHPREVLARFDRRMFTPEERGTEAFTRWKQGRQEYLPSRRVLRAGLDYLCRYDISDEARLIQCPVDVLHGGRDAVCPRAGGERLVTALPTGLWTVWEEAGHLPFWTQPGRFEQWLKERLEIAFG